jgi:hypothetical protein
MRAIVYSAIAASLMLASSTAVAGEITGPKPTSNLDPAPPISNGNSFCKYSGLNDTPDGLIDPNTGAVIDPGGPIQSYGYFMSHYDAFDSSDPAQRDSFYFPGTGCNGHDIPLNG